jgi:carbohydrate-binding DOMON domain-containing protein
MASDMIAHPAVKGVAFTGSTPVGKMVGAAAVLTYTYTYTYTHTHTHTHTNAYIFTEHPSHTLIDTYSFLI